MFSFAGKAFRNNGSTFSKNIVDVITDQVRHFIIINLVPSQKRRAPLSSRNRRTPKSSRTSTRFRVSSFSARRAPRRFTSSTRYSRRPSCLCPTNAMGSHHAGGPCVSATVPHRAYVYRSREVSSSSTT